MPPPWPGSHPPWERGRPALKTTHPAPWERGPTPPPPLGTRASRPRNKKPRHPLQWLALTLLLPTTLTLAQPPPPDPSTTPQQPESTSLLQSFFQETQHLQADFIQLEFDLNGAFQLERTGRLYLSRPGRFRVDYLEPEELMIWVDGDSVSMFDRELEQVTIWKQAKRLGKSAAALLAGDASILESYEVTAAELEDGLQWFDLAAANTEEGDLRLALRDNLPRSSSIPTN